MMASSSGVRTVERGCFGPMAASAVDCRPRHFWIVVGLTLKVRPLVDYGYGYDPDVRS